MHYKLLLCLAALLALALALGATQPALAHDDSGDKLDATLEGTPAGPFAADFTATVDPLVSGSTLQLQWNLPPGVELLGGPAQSEWADPQAGTPAREARSVRVAAPGVYRIAIGGGLDAFDGIRYVQGAILYMSVGADGAVTLSRSDPEAVELDGSIMPATVQQSMSAAATHSPDGDPCFNVTGIVTREEHTPDRNGYRPMVRVPVRAARIEMREEDTLFDDSYGEVLTGSDGSFAFSFCDDDGVFDDELELYVRLHANLWRDGHDVVEVQEDGLIPPEDVYEFDSGVIESEGGTYFINFDLNREQSAVFNIADAILDAWLVWNANGGAVGDDAIFGYQAEVNWESGDDDDKTFYNGYVWDEITIADSNSNPDEWDDGVIIHEWTHQADDNYGCDDNPGGPHSSSDNNQDLELAFAEGFANYYQSAVRSAVGRPDGNFYLDGLGPGGMMGGFDLETRDVAQPTLVTTRNEAAVAALMWDLEDSASDGQDRAGFGLRANQENFTDPIFSDNGDVFDDTCTTWVYLTSWRDAGKQADKAVAAIIQQNVGLANFFGVFGAQTSSSASVAGAQEQTGTSAPQGERQTGTSALQDAGGFKWWKNLTFVVDNSASMAEAGKLDAVKTVMKEQVNDLAPAAKGVEFNVYTFNNTSPALQQPVQRKFYADLANPAIDSVATVNAPDADCSVQALAAIAQAAQLQSGGDVWLYTDRASALGPGVDSVRRLLSGRQVRGSFAMLGGCAAVLPTRMSDVTGGEINYLGKAANGSQSTGIVPYLLTSLGTGGQFIYVREDQLGSAADILRAQVANSAGAGKWSDYVSDDFTYRWDRLEAGEYQWFPAESLGTAVDQLPSTGYMTYNLPRPFSYYGSSFSSVGVNQDGVLELDPCTTINCGIIRISRSFLDVLSTDMQWDFVPFPPRRVAGDPAGAADSAPEAAAGPAAATGDPDAVFTPGSAGNVDACARLFNGQPRLPGDQVCLYQANLGFEWHIISVQGYASDGVYRAYQVWLNLDTGEIRFQYGNLRGEAATAEIGLRRRFNIGFPPVIDKFLVSNRDSAGAFSGMGYKLTPAPAQPTRVYTVAVDSLMEGVGFLQTGYSGAFEPMIVRDPAGQPVDCADTANVLCLTMDNIPGDRMVQYVQVNVNGRTGDWTATIDAQEGREGTFTFSGLAASSIAASTVGERSLPAAGPVRLSVGLGRATDFNTLTAWLQRPNGERFGANFELYDDGLHGDGRANDGLFSVPDFAAPGAGVAYLWVAGAISGEGFVRSDPVPYNFQPLAVTVLNKTPVFTGLVVPIPVHITNYDNRTQCFYYGDRVTVPDGWGYFWAIPPGDDGSEQFFGVCIPPGGSIERLLQVTPSGEFEAGPSGASSDVTVSFVERERGAIVASDGATISLYREPVEIRILNGLGEAALRPNGVDTTTLSVGVYDYTGYPVQDGTLVEIATDLGDVEPSPLAAASAAGPDSPAAGGYTGETEDGRLAVLFTAPTAPGDATVSATVNGRTVTATVYIRAATAETVELAANPADLSGGGASSTLLATLRDAWGDPLPGATVRIGIADDSGTQGTLGGSDVFTGTTNAQGQVQVTFTRVPGATGQVVARAEYVVVAGGREYIPAEDSAVIRLAAPERRVYLPDVRR